MWQPSGQMPNPGQESPGVEIRQPSQSQVIQALVYYNSRSLCKQLGTQGAQIFQPGYLSQESIWGRCLRRAVAKGPQVWMGRGPDHDHTLSARLELVPRDHVPSNRATEKVEIITLAPMECNNQESNSKGHEKYPIDCLEAHITICVQSVIGEEIAKKVTNIRTKEAKQHYQQMFEQWCSFCHRRELPVLKSLCEQLGGIP